MGPAVMWRNSDRNILTSLSSMLLLANILVLLSLATAQFPYWGLATTRLLASNAHSRQMMSRRFMMRAVPGDSMFLKRYLSFWGTEDVDTMAEQVAETPLEITISDDGTMVTMVYGEESSLTFGEASDITDTITGKDTDAKYCLSSLLVW